MPLRDKFPEESKAVVVYAEIVIITLIAGIVAAFAGVYLLGQYRSDDGLSGPEITLIVTGALTMLNQLGILRLGKQNKELGKEVDGNLSARLDRQTEKIDEDARERKANG